MTLGITLENHFFSCELDQTGQINHKLLLNKL